MGNETGGKRPVGGKCHDSLENSTALVSGGTPHDATAAEGITPDAELVTVYLDSSSSNPRLARLEFGEKVCGGDASM